VALKLRNWNVSEIQLLIICSVTFFNENGVFNA
jgi:hypothetical protein